MFQTNFCRTVSLTWKIFIFNVYNACKKGFGAFDAATEESNLCFFVRMRIKVLDTGDVGDVDVIK